MIKICRGCGIKLQTQNKEEKGYVKDLSMDYCMRCFRLIHYQDYDKAYYEKDPEAILKKINNQKGKVYFFIDFLNLHEEAISFYHQIKLPKILIITKIDGIPQNISLAKIENWCKKIYHIKEKILFVRNSRTSGKKIIEEITSEKEEKIFFMGITNAGKSSLLNQILEEGLTTSPMPNTTLDWIELNCGTHKIYDTPGLSYHYIENQALIRKANIKSKIKPMTIPLKKEGTLLIENEIFLSFDRDIKMTWYKENQITIKKIYEKKEESTSYHIPENSMIFLKGLGFFEIKESCKMKVLGLKEENISIVPSFLEVRYE